MEEDVPVLVVGGGGCGLASSIFLSNLGVRSLLVERNADTTDHPRAHILNQRTMEIFRQHGLAEAVYGEGTPPQYMERISFRTSLGGSGPMDRRLIGNLDGYGGGALRQRYDADSPCRATNLPLMQLEPLLRRAAEERRPGAARFGHELLSFEARADGVTATVRDHARNTEYRVRARYMVGADGGKTVGRLLGTEMAGLRRLRRMVNTYFEADLSPWIDDDGVLIFYFMSPDGKGVWAGGGLVKTGPTRWDRHSETWVLMRELGPDEPDRIDESNVAPAIRELLRIPDLRLRVRKIGRWDVEGVSAKRYRFGPVFLAGDAAHRHPPVSALGLNTAFGDAHNLAWKLKLVLEGGADDALLDSYDDERRPVGARVAEWALNGFRMRSLIDTAIGLAPGATEQNRRAFEELFADTPGGATRRAILGEVMRIQRVGPQAHDMEIGYAYGAGALIPDGTPAPERDPMASEYRPGTRPGMRLPHVWLERNGRRISTHDLVPADRFLLIASHDWHGAAGRLPFEVATTMVPALPGMDARGALLVRPDAHVAWRSGPVRDPEEALDRAFSAITRRRS